MYGAKEPGAKLCDSTVPITPLVQASGEAAVTTAVKPAFCRTPMASVVLEDTTLGTTIWQTPVEVIKVIVAPEATFVPAAGDVLTTLPIDTLFEQVDPLAGETVRPTWPSAEAACPTVCPCNDGTG